VAQVTTQDYGIKVARPGYDVNTCPDWALLFNSSWPSLAVTLEQTFTMSTDDGSTSQEFTHKLGFPPLAMAWVSTDGVSYSRLPQSNIAVNSQTVTVFFDPSHYNLALVTIIVRCYNTDLSKDNSYPLPISSAVQLPYDPSFGVKVSKTQKSISSGDLRNFVLHSRAQSPAILDICTQDGPYFTGSAITYPLRTSYLPWFAGAVKIDDSYFYFPITSIDYDAINKTLSLNLANTPEGGTLIVMRDPLFYPKTVEIVY
jgi:hypothetical protein